MKPPFRRWLQTVSQLPGGRAVLTAATLVVAGGTVAGPALAIGAASPATTASAAVSTAKPVVPVMGAVGQPVAAKPAAASSAPAAPVPNAKELSVDYQPQVTYYYCAPAATRIAASAQGHDLSQDDLAAKLGTTEAGTPSAEDTTRVLNDVLGTKAYHTTAIPDATANQGQIERLQSDVIHALEAGRPVVANVKGATVDNTGAQHDFAGGHYLTVVAFHDFGRTVEISDPADVNGSNSYWLNTTDLANWIATRGYSS